MAISVNTVEDQLKRLLIQNGADTVSTWVDFNNDHRFLGIKVGTTKAVLEFRPHVSMDIIWKASFDKLEELKTIAAVKRRITGKQSWQAPD